MIQPKIITLSQTNLIGKKLRMSHATDKTLQLWQSFMPRLKEIKDSVSKDLYAVAIYDDPDFFKAFDPGREFEKWAAIEVSDFDTVPDDMETLHIPEGLYAVFHYKGRASEAMSTFQYIFDVWFPNSEYELDNRPHFALMGEKYKNDDPESEEEFWVPVVVG